MQLYTKILIGMAVGTAAGLLLGPNSPLLPQDGGMLMRQTSVVSSPTGGEPIALAKGVTDVAIVQETDGWVKVEWKLTPQLLLKQKKMMVAEANEAKPGTIATGWVADKPDQISRYAPLGKTAVDWTEWLGRLFLALIKMVVVPLVFCSLVVGVASLGDFRKLGRLGGRTIGFFTGTTAVALCIGLGLANIVKPGEWMSEEDRASLLMSYSGGASDTVGNAADAPGVVDQLIAIIPSNPFKSLATGDMLPIIFFALMFGIALTMLKPERSKLVVDVTDTCNDAMVMLVHIAMKLAPYGVAALLFKVTGTTGISVLAALGVYAVVVIAGLGLHIAFTYALTVTFGAKLNFLKFLSAIKAAIMLAFSTSSSSATLPVTKQCAEDNVNVSNEVSSFVLPLGATVNMDGTALYQGVAALFIAQIYSIDLTVADQATIVLSATMASIGAAGVPGAGMITLALVLTSIGVPTEGLALVLGVDRLLDMFRTATNVIGDSTAAAFMGRLEGNDLQFLTPEQDAADPDKGFEGRLERDPVAVKPDDDPSADAKTAASEARAAADEAKAAAAEARAADEEAKQIAEEVKKSKPPSEAAEAAAEPTDRGADDDEAGGDADVVAGEDDAADAESDDDADDKA